MFSRVYNVSHQVCRIGRDANLRPREFDAKSAACDLAAKRLKDAGMSSTV